MRRFTKIEGYTLVELLIVVAIVGMVAGAIVGVYQVSQSIYVRATALEAAQLGVRAGLDRMANELRLIGSFWVGANGAGNAITAATSTSITFMASVDDRSMVGNPLAQAPEATASPATTLTSVPLSLTATTINEAFKCYGNPALNDYIYIADGGTRDVRQIATINGNSTCNNINDRTITLTSNLSSIYPAGSLVRDVKIITYARNAADKTLTRSQGGSGADAIVDNVTGLTFIYYDTTGSRLPPGQDQNPPPCPVPGPNPDPSLIREIRVDLKVQGADGSARCMTTRVKPRSLP